MRYILLFFAFHLLQTTHTLQQAKSSNCQAYTPKKGSAERKELLNVLRFFVKENMNTDVVFVVKYMKVFDGWAWVHTLPQSVDGLQHYEDLLALLKYSRSKWTITEIPCVEEDNPLCISNPDYYENLLKRHINMPVCILPGTKP